MSDPIVEQKRRAAERSLDLIETGMAVGLGSGSTAALMVELLGERVRGGLKIVGVPTSVEVGRLARDHGIPLTSLEEAGRLDLTIDGADEIDPELRLIKGGGGALVREKIVASLSARMVVIADAGKLVDRLGAFPLPVAVVPFASLALLPRLADLGCTARLRRLADGTPFRSDDGNRIVDCAFGAMADPEGLAHALESIPGVVEHGLFLGLAGRAIVGTADGVREVP